MDEGKVTIMMDNARVHYKADVREEKIDSKVKILYNVAYCCYLNPVEYCFSYIKSHLQRQCILENDDLITKAEEYLESNCEKDSKPALLHSLKVFKKIMSK